MQEFESTEDFSRQVMEGTIDHNLNQIAEAVKKHLNLVFNKIAKIYPEITSVSWQQDFLQPYTHPCYIDINQMDYFGRKRKKDYLSSQEEYLKQDDKIINVKTQYRYALFFEQVKEDSDKQIQYFEKLDAAAEIFSKELKKINPFVLMLVFGKKVTITVTQEKFNYLYNPIPLETCDG